MAKNIVVCCDGTGNEIEDNQSNVLNYYRCLKKSDDQLVYYDPGLGTLGANNEWARIRQNTEKVAGLALGYGLDRNVLDAYRFIVSQFIPGDRLYFAGFSRGAYTVRVLAGFINSIGLLRPEQMNLCGYALVAYKQISEGDQFSSVRQFERTLRPHRPSIRFLGLWDTVSSVIVPRKDRLYIPSLRQLAYTAKNPSVEIVRHALAIDERRRMFRPYLWQHDQPYWGGPFEQPDAPQQNLGQRWFAGVHSDVGGGYAESESGLAKLTLKWMIEESPEELKFVRQTVNQVALGEPRAGSRRHYVSPDPAAPLHESMTNWWRILEWLPKRAKRREWSRRRSRFGLYLPREESRFLADDAQIDESVRQRMNSVSDYQPINVPPRA